MGHLDQSRSSSTWSSLLHPALQIPSEHLGTQSAILLPTYMLYIAVLLAPLEVPALPGAAALVAVAPPRPQSVQQRYRLEGFGRGDAVLDSAFLLAGADGISQRIAQRRADLIMLYLKSTSCRMSSGAQAAAAI